jgi:hypothetical protein
MTEKLFLILSFVVIIEALVEYVKGFIDSAQTKEWRTIIIQLSALIIAVVVCCVAKVNIFDYLGFDINATFGCIVTGVFASRGSNVVHDVIKRIELIKGSKVNINE